MAHSLHPLIDATEAGISNLRPPRILNLVRDDKESSKKKISLNKVGFDWPNLLQPYDYWVFKLYHYMIRLPFLRKKALNIWSTLSDEIIFRSINHFSSHSIIHTDRLHGLILSTLLGKETHLRDNSYGKNLTYYNAWLKETPYLEINNG
jgi:pyruvyl transferase EpsO